jgi:probable rRNA maturation factor
MLGDIVICPSVAAANAPEHAGTLDDELALLVVHGVLHVLGHDHAEPDEAREMRAIEADLLARFHGPVAAGTEIPQAEAHP